MTYDKPLPQVDTLRQLAQAMPKFPATSVDLIRTAKRLHLAKHAIEFIKLFPPNERFADRNDFLDRSEELELLIDEERHMPPEVIKSPQD